MKSHDKDTVRISTYKTLLDGFKHINDVHISAYANV